MEWNEQRMKQRGMEKGVVRTGSMNLQYTNIKGIAELMKDTCSIVAHGPGWCEWNSDGFFIMFLDIEQGMQFLHDSELLKTEMICAKCSKTMKICKSKDTVDKWF
jgi:hypothetical protein